jgi:hypothetical protein
MAPLVIHGFLGIVANARLFRRGDSDGNGMTNLTDAITTLNYLFLGGDAPACLDAVDANDDGLLNLTDATYTLNFLFLEGPRPPAPGDRPGNDPTPDALECGSP